ncbi:MAG: NtaA/DmoA family FMN-dependent monooxygenase [Gordonia sp. (in: high G+C Gram-positive bacteria)]
MSSPQHFGWFVGQGFGVQGWGYDGWLWGHRWERPDVWIDAVRAAEAAGFDLFLFKDGTIVQAYDELPDTSVGSAEGGPRHEPMLLLPYLLQSTKRIAVLPTLNSTHYDPYHAARQIATLYHFEPGRVGLNIVTGVEKEAVRNIGTVREILSHDDAYAKADEWATILRRLWTSWDRDAVVADADHYRYALAERIHRIDYKGRFFDVAGPSVTLPFDDEGPVFSSPGSSELGLAYAGKHSDIQFSFGISAAHVRANREKIAAAAVAAGRGADSVKVFSVISPRIVDSADAKAAVVAELSSDDALRKRLSIISVILKVDFAALDLDKPIPARLLDDPVVGHTVGAAFLAGVDNPAQVPFRELVARSVHGAPGDLIGTPDEIADYIEAFGEESGHAGFLFNFNVDPWNVHNLLGRLVPVLKRRGILRSEFSGTSLRSHLSDF